MATNIPKIRSKNFTKDETMTLVDLVEANKLKLFGSLSCNLTFDDKNKVWDEIAGRFSEFHGTRTRDEISKKWYNILSKHKPGIADKLASARMTGGGPAEPQLDELELKIANIKGRECFKGIESGIDLTLSSLSGEDNIMVVSPAPSINREEKFFPKKRIRSEDSYDEVKKELIEIEEKKIAVLTNIDEKLGRVVSLLERTATDQAQLISIMASQSMPPYPIPQNLYQTSTLQMPHYYPPNKDLLVLIVIYVCVYVNNYIMFYKLNYFYNY